MPYISKALRPTFDRAILLLKMERYGETVQCILGAIKNMGPHVMDGCLNYVFTQMLRKVNNLTDVKVVMDLVLNTIFWTEPNYIKFERVEGLLNRMIKEYKRRKWGRVREVTKALKQLLLMNDHYCAKYEDEKIRQYGDLQ